MPVRFSRLRIAGFKSFAEATSVEILPGLTGIVGPNGCGKSNVVEALRWAMGESSAKNMRGGEMDDVIFAGTTARASRNIAEVTLITGGGAGPGAAPFQRAAGTGDQPPDRARQRQRLSGERPRGPGARRADVVRRPRLRRAVLGDGQPGPGRHDRQCPPGGPPLGAGGSGGHHRAARETARGGAEAARGGGQYGPRRGSARAAGRPARRAEAPGAAGQPLPQHLRQYPPGGAGTAVDSAGSGGKGPRGRPTGAA